MKLKIFLLCLLILGGAALWIPRGPALPPGLTFAQITNPSTGLPTGLTFASPTLTVSSAGNGNGVLSLSGNASGTFTHTAAADGTTETLSGTEISLASSTQAAPAFTVNGSGSLWKSTTAATDIVFGTSTTKILRVGPNIGAVLATDAWIGWTNANGSSSGADTNSDTTIAKAATKVLNIGASGDASGIVRSGNKIAVTASDFTDANSAALQAITGLSVTVPAIGTTSTYSFHCSLMYSQATNVAGDQFGIGILTTAPTSASAFGTAFTNTGAAAPVSTGVLTGLATTTPTAVVTFQPAVTSVLGATLDGTFEQPNGAFTFNVYVLNGTAADVIVIKRGSYCQVF